MHGKLGGEDAGAGVGAPAAAAAATPAGAGWGPLLCALLLATEWKGKGGWGPAAGPSPLVPCCAARLAGGGLPSAMEGVAGGEGAGAGAPSMLHAASALAASDEPLLATSPHAEPLPAPLIRPPAPTPAPCPTPSPSPWPSPSPSHEPSPCASSQALLRPADPPNPCCTPADTQDPCCAPAGVGPQLSLCCCCWVGACRAPCCCHTCCGCSCWWWSCCWGARGCGRGGWGDRGLVCGLKSKGSGVDLVRRLCRGGTICDEGARVMSGERVDSLMLLSSNGGAGGLMASTWPDSLRATHCRVHMVNPWASAHQHADYQHALIRIVHTCTHLRVRLAFCTEASSLAAAGLMAPLARARTL